MSSLPPQEMSRLLAARGGGGETALERLLPPVEAELRREMQRA